MQKNLNPLRHGCRIVFIILFLDLSLLSGIKLSYEVYCASKLKNAFVSEFLSCNQNWESAVSSLYSFASDSPYSLLVNSSIRRANITLSANLDLNSKRALGKISASKSSKITEDLCLYADKNTIGISPHSASGTYFSLPLSEIKSLLSSTLSKSEINYSGYTKYFQTIASAYLAGKELLSGNIAADCIKKLSLNACFFSCDYIPDSKSVNGSMRQYSFKIRTEDMERVMAGVMSDKKFDNAKKQAENLFSKVDGNYFSFDVGLLNGKIKSIKCTTPKIQNCTYTAHIYIEDSGNEIKAEIYNKTLNADILEFYIKKEQNNLNFEILNCGNSASVSFTLNPDLKEVNTNTHYNENNFFSVDFRKKITFPIVELTLCANNKVKPVASAVISKGSSVPFEKLRMVPMADASVGEVAELGVAVSGFAKTILG